MVHMSRRTGQIATIVAILSVAGGFAVASTASFTLPYPGGASGGSGAGSQGATPFSDASVISVSVMATNAVPSGSPLGSQVGPLLSLQGTAAAQVACTSESTCYTYWNPAEQTAGSPAADDYSVQIVIQVTQPASTGTAFGFDYQFTIPLTGGGATTVTADIYVDSGLATALPGGTATLDLYVYVDTGVVNTGTAPTFATYAVSANGCPSVTACP